MKPLKHFILYWVTQKKFSKAFIEFDQYLEELLRKESYVMLNLKKVLTENELSIFLTENLRFIARFLNLLYFL